MKSLNSIAKLIAQYRKDYDFYEQACRIVAQTLEPGLSSRWCLSSTPVVAVKVQTDAVKQLFY